MMDASMDAIRWTFQVHNDSARSSLHSVTFPMLSLAKPGPEPRLFLPRGPGEVHSDVWGKPFQYRSRYPNGWTGPMPFFAVYADTAGVQGRRSQSGLYAAVHDPSGGVKELAAESRPEKGRLGLSFEHPVENQDKPGSSFTLGGEAVWQLLRGDWFDAAQNYRSWCRRKARWWPKLTRVGRTDTPAWMRELCVWVQASGGPSECVPAVKAFAKFMGVPVGFHWYQWHQIPFDNDYPHYFPAKEGFVDGVRELQRSGVHVMPYINGRLWDTRDRGLEDFEFTRVALPAATKNEKGTPWTESYGSKETDGSPVKLAVMCPATKLWQRKVQDIVLRLFEECGVDGVYIDQIGAAAPVLCFDASHGHPLGGGRWWNEGYWEMLRAIRKKMPAGRMLTTECNAETYVRWFDGYLSWNWQTEGQVAAFPAIYAPAIQNFGRSYGGGSTRDLALRMKAGQQWVFGEQIGWISPDVVKEAANAEFLRGLVRLRWQLRRYFHSGEMARPPALSGPSPQVRADWQWGGEAWVSGPAVLTAAWRLPREKKVALMYVNVGAETAVSVPFDLPLSGRWEICEVLPTGRGPAERVSGPVSRTLELPPCSARALEVSSRKIHPNL
ncbi:MAG: hypothetical protein HYU36_19990 [Planctomycetes bacterium]|nr:hypothetical protein [Planctomycetota bacterium]